MLLSFCALPLVLGTVDGDTVECLPTGANLRLEAIDAPERGHRADCRSERDLAESATRRMEELLRDVVAVEDSGRTGGYGRPLVRLRLRNGQTVAEVLISEGLAVQWAGRRHEWC
ncbi:thermonuclease family protein [Aestuariibius insulae]|uniref:thermonuclease family protein n=1 Tax=Aestuariibius insulae TaxID=2058287 RepID=UPI00345E17C0